MPLLNYTTPAEQTAAEIKEGRHRHPGSDRSRVGEQTAAEIMSILVKKGATDILTHYLEAWPLV